MNSSWWTNPLHQKASCVTEPTQSEPPNSIPLRHRKAITHVGVARGSARGGQDENKQPRDRNSGA